MEVLLWLKVEKNELRGSWGANSYLPHSCKKIPKGDGSGRHRLALKNHTDQEAKVKSAVRCQRERLGKESLGENRMVFEKKGRKRLERWKIWARESPGIERGKKGCNVEERKMKEGGKRLGCSAIVGFLN